jgi:hypothetical protein
MQNHAKHTLTALAFAVAALATVTPRDAAAEVLINEDVPIEETLDNPCTGEEVLLSGRAHQLLRVTENGNTYHFGRHFNAAGVTGVGVTSGARYVLGATFNDEFTIAKGGTQTSVQTLNVIGTGRTPNFLVRALFHVTIDANGDVHSDIDNYRSECR